MNRRNFTKAAFSASALAGVGGTTSEVYVDERAIAYVEQTDDPFPGCKILVYAGGWQVPFVLELDLRARTVTRMGSILLDWPDGVLEGRFETRGGEHFIDGIPSWEWGMANKQTIAYDAIVLRGEFEFLHEYQQAGKVPQGWLLQTPMGPADLHDHQVRTEQALAKVKRLLVTA